MRLSNPHRPSTTSTVRLQIPQQVLIGLGYRTGVGKSTIAHYLVEHHGFIRRSIAHALKTTASQLLGHACDSPEFKHSWLIKGTGREFLQKLAEFIRDELGDDYFITSLKLPELLEESPRIVIDDVRFASEVAHIHRLNGFAFEIIRPSLIHVNGDRELSTAWTGSKAKWNAQISNVDVGFAADQILSCVCGEALAPLPSEVAKPVRIAVSALRRVGLRVPAERLSSLVSSPAEG